MGRLPVIGKLLPLFLVLCIIPVGGSGYRIFETLFGAITPENARFMAMPIPIVVHALSASIFLVLGTLQLAPRLHRPRSNWHRRAGWVAVVASIAGALSGLWMAQFYPRVGGELLHYGRLVFGSIWAYGAIRAVWAIRQRDIDTHRAWMLRSYSIALVAATMPLFALPWMAVFGEFSQLGNALTQILSWTFNLCVAEWIIRRARSAPPIRNGAIA